MEVPVTTKTPASRPLTKEQFRAQFPVEVRFEGFEPVYSETFHGYEVYRALQMLVVKENGKFYGTGR
jgi:hypothetical protein